MRANVKRGKMVGSIHDIATTLLKYIAYTAIAGMVVSIPIASAASGGKTAHDSKYKDRKGVAIPSKCGGIGQPACISSSAMYMGKHKKKKPSQRAFIDPRKGSEYWECPKDKPRRTAYAVTDKKACATPIEKLGPAKFVSKVKNKKPSRAFIDPRKGGEYWRCPSDKPRRTAYSVTNRKACATKRIFGEKLGPAKYLGKVKNKKPSGAFFDPRKGGEYWRCPKDKPRRTAYAVTDKRACATRFTEKLGPAKYLGKAFNAKPSGAFYDLRKGGEYWKCPTNFMRGVTPVNSWNACIAQIGKKCDSNNVSVGLFVGTTCYKRMACGKKNQRPCLIEERIPSCNKGLAEDFVANKCIPTDVAICLTAARTARIASKAGDALSEVDQFVNKALKAMIKELNKAIPGLEKALNEGGDKLLGEIEKATSKATKGLGRLIEEAKILGPYTNEIMMAAEAFDKNQKKIKNLMFSDEFCTISAQKRVDKIIKLLDASKLIAASAEEVPETGLLASLMEGFFIKSAHAAAKKPPLVFLLNVSVGTVTPQRLLVGGGYTYAFNTAGKSGLLAGGFVGAAPLSKPGPDIALSLGIVPNKAFKDLGGINFNIGGSLNFNKVAPKSPLRFLAGAGIEISFEPGDKKGTIVFESISFSHSLIALTKKRDPLVEIEISVSAETQITEFK